MTAELERVGVRQWPAQGGGMVWAGPEATLRAELARASADGRLASRGPFQPMPGRPGVVAVRVHLVEPARAAGRQVSARSRRLPAPARWVWPAIGGTAALGLVGIAVAMLLDALVALLPVLLGIGVIVVLLVLFGRGGGGGGGAGRGGSITMSQTITFH